MVCIFYHIKKVEGWKMYYANTNQKKIQVVVLFPFTTNYHKLGGLKQPKYYYLTALGIQEYTIRSLV